MIISEIHGNLFDHVKYNTDSIIYHGCNNIGKMGAGFALEFKKLYPESFEKYVNDCELFKNTNNGKADIKMCGYNVHKRENGNRTISAITQHLVKSDKWPNPAKLEYIQESIKALEEINKIPEPPYNIIADRVIHCPKVGCGLGGLEWNDVRSILEGSSLRFAVYYL